MSGVNPSRAGLSDRYGMAVLGDTGAVVVITIYLIYWFTRFVMSFTGLRLSVVLARLERDSWRVSVGFGCGLFSRVVLGRCAGRPGDRSRWPAPPWWPEGTIGQADGTAKLRSTRATASRQRPGAG